MLIDTAERVVFRNTEASARRAPALRVVPTPAPVRPEALDRNAHREAEADARSRKMSFDALAALSIGVFVVNGSRDLRLMNAAAERIARGGFGLCACRGRLRLSDAKLDEQLRAAILCAGLSRSTAAAQAIVVRSRDNEPLSLLVRPLPADSSAEPAETLAAVFVSEPAARRAPSMELVRAAYELTAAEARVLAAILGGQRACEYAAASGLSCNTVQTQMKALYAKTGCHSQADLVRKILSDPMLRLSQAWDAASG